MSNICLSNNSGRGLSIFANYSKYIFQFVFEDENGFGNLKYRLSFLEDIQHGEYLRIANLLVGFHSALFIVYELLCMFIDGLLFLALNQIFVFHVKYFFNLICYESNYHE